MISRVARARHVCLTCRFGDNPRAAALLRTLPIQRDLGRRRFASAQDVSKDEILDALMSGRRTVGNKAGKRERLPSWGVEKPKTTKPRTAKATARDAEAKNEHNEVRPIWEEMENRSGPLRKARRELESSRLGFERQEEKQVSTDPINDDLSRFLQEAVTSQKVEDELEAADEPAIQDDFDKLPTEMESREVPESSESGQLNETVETDDQQQPPERTIGRSFSDEDFSYWAADSKKTKASPRNVQTSEESQTQKPYMVGRTRLDRQSVGLGALGQKFDALVMNDPDALGRRERLVPAQSQLPPSIALDPQAFAPVDDSNMEPDEEAFHNLDSLRPTMSSTLTRHEFESLRNLIAEGFNGSQLVLYWQRHRDPEAKPADPSAAYTWLKDLGTWKPVDDEMFQASVEKKAKSSYANRILTQIWGLQVQEEVEMPGRVTVRLPAMPHALISNPNLGFLETMKAEILDETLGENIIATEGGKKTLTIIARKPVVPVILARIDTILGSLDKQEISLDGVPRELIKRENLNELERVTRAIIMHSAPDSPILDICWPRSDDVDEAPESHPERETPADTVRRLLLGRHVPIRTAEEQLVAKRFRGEGVAARAGTLIPYHRETRSMSWKDRLAPWARFIIPAPAELKKVRWLKLPDRVVLPHMNEASESGKDLLTATFGHILHAPLPKPKTRGRSKATYRRTISPVMPHPAAFTDLFPKENHHIIKKSFIVVHFVPAPGATDGARAPALKLTMPFTGQEDFSTFTLPKKSILQAPKSSFVKDILFPEEMVDARVERSCDLKLDIAEQSAFQDFINASEFNAAGILQTPKETRFNIPQTWLSKPGRKPAKSEDTADLPYLFGGLEVRQTLDLPWQDNINIRYESVEAGQHGDTRQELSLVLDLARLETSKVQSSVRDFLWKLGDVVEGKFWSWSQGVAKLKDLPPNADEMVDKMRQGPAPKRSKVAATAPVEPELLEEELFEGTGEPGALVEHFENEVAFDDGLKPTANGLGVELAFDENTGSRAAPRSEVVDWTSAPMAPSSEPQLDPSVVDAVAEFEQMLMDEAGSIAPAFGFATAADVAQIETDSSASADDLTSAAEADPHATAPSTTQASNGPFSPTSSKQKDHPKRSRRQQVLGDDRFEEVDETESDVEEYEAMDPEALRAKMEAEAGAASLAELYRRAGATPEQIAALEGESKKFEKEWKEMHERLPSDEEEPRSREEIEAEDKMLKQFLAEDIARIEEEDMLAEDELGDDDDIDVDLAEEKRKKKLRKRRGSI